MTKKELCMLNSYNGARMTILEEAYKRPSYTKIKIYNKILEDMMDLNGHSFKSTGANCNTFSCAFLYERDNQVRLRYYTAWNTYDFIVEEL